MESLNPSLAYPLSQIDPHIDSKKNDALRFTQLKPFLRLFAKSVDNLAFVDPASDSSFGALLSSQPMAALGRPIVEDIFGKAEKCRICLISPICTILSPQEADELCESEREQCIAIQGQSNVALMAKCRANTKPHIIVTVPATVNGGLRDAKIDIELVSADTVKMCIVSSSGTRKYMTSGKLPDVLLKRLFETNNTSELAGESCRSNVLTRNTQLAIASFLERKLRLQVLCTASVPAPGSRPVALESVRLMPFSRASSSWASVRAVLHQSSASCICAAHGLRIGGVNRVEAIIETCGRDLEKTPSGQYRCPCHKQELDDTGNSRNNQEGLCTEGTCISVRCLHTNGGVTRAPGARIDRIPLNDAERLELSSILMNALEFEARTRDCYNAKGYATNQPKINHQATVLGEKLRQRLSDAERKQLAKEDYEETNPRAMLQRDMMAVDLMRGGGVFLHVKTKHGIRKRELKRERKTEQTKPLSQNEAELVTTHGHLFRKAI